MQCFGEVSKKKIGGVYENQLSTEQPRPKLPIVHFSELAAPFLIAVKTDLHEGGLEENIDSMGMAEQDWNNFIHVG